MNLNASSVFRILSGTTAGIMVLVSAATAKTICNCPSPPGGGVSCNDDQVAFCQLRTSGCSCWCDLASKLSGATADGFAVTLFGMALKQEFTTIDLSKRIGDLDLKPKDGQYELINQDTRILFHLPATASEITPQIDATIQHIGDLKIVHKVELATHDLPAQAPITATAHDGTVVLHGQVESSTTKSVAADRAFTVEGVKHVENGISVTGSGPPP